MSVQHVIALFRRAEALKKEVDGTRDVGGDKQSEIFRLFGMIEWVLKEELDGVLEEMEDQALARKIQEALEEAKKEIKSTQIVALERVNVKKTEELPSFPKYLELPGPLVREKILSFLSADDLVAVATAIPSEVQYFPQQLIYLQMQAVFPILMQKKLLKPKDVMNLSGVDPNVCNFIVKYYENVLWKDSELYYEYFSVTLWDLIGLEGDYPVVSRVRVVLNGEVESTSLEQLQICGKRILHCGLDLHAVEDDQITMERIASCLKLMPNLRTLSIVDHGFVQQQEIAGLVRPELPWLRHLALVRNWSGTVLQSMMLRKYGEKLELVYLYEPAEPPFGFQIPGPDASVTVLMLDFDELEPMLNVGYLLRTFAHCPLKELHLTLMHSIFHPLVIFLSSHWVGTLEVLEIRFLDLYSHGDHYDENWNPNWTMNLRLPKLRYFTTDYYKCYMNWSILLLFPALEELSICEVGDECECTLCSDWDDDDSDDSEQVDDGTQPIIQLHCDKDAVLSSNLWKLFPKLEKVTFGEFGIILGSVTRKECIAAQMEM